MTTRISMALMAAMFVGGSALVGCDKTVAKNESEHKNADGTMDKKEEKTVQKPDGKTETTKTEKTVDKP